MTKFQSAKCNKNNQTENGSPESLFDLNDLHALYLHHTKHVFQSKCVTNIGIIGMFLT